MINPLPVAATFSKDSKFWGVDFEPSELHWGDGATVFAESAKQYLEWTSALGANLLGYSNSEFINRVVDVVSDGAAYPLPHYLERQAAAKLVTLLGDHVPGWTPEGLGVRWGLSGSDATTMAVRLARAVTGREGIFTSGYHGWSDWSVSVTPPAWGVPKGQPVWDCCFGQVPMFADEIAAFIVEQPPQDAPPGYWQMLRKRCSEHGVLLIVDEIVTGFRYAMGGACERYGIEPDIVCVGKALGNGIPVSAMVGRREYFDWFSRNDPCFVSSTGFGNAVSMAAADAVLDIWDQSGVDHLWRIGQLLMDGLREAGYNVIGHPPRSLLQFASPSDRGYFIREMAARGVLINRPNIPNWAHTESDVQQTVKAAAEVKAAMANIDVEREMAGRLPATLFEGR